MAQLVKWHDAHARDAKRVRYRSAVRGRFLFSQQLRPIAGNDQRPILVRPAKEAILKTCSARVLSNSVRALNSQISPGSLDCSPCRPESLSAASVQPSVDDAVIRVYDAAGNVIETHEYAGEFKEP